MWCTPFVPKMVACVSDRPDYSVKNYAADSPAMIQRQTKRFPNTQCFYRFLPLFGVT